MSRVVEKIWNEKEKLRSYVFGQKRERYIPNSPDQLLFDKSEEDHTPSNEVIIPSYTRKIKGKKHPGREELPPHLPRKILELIPQEVRDNPENYKNIGTLYSEQLEMEPARFWVKKTVRPKYINTATEEFSIAPMPFNIFGKGLAGATVVSDILTKKYADHLPLYRINKIYKRSKIKINESTMVGWIKRVVELLEPIYNIMCEKVKDSRIIQADESPIPVLDPDNDKTHRGYMFVYVLDKKYCIFDYQHSRGKEGPLYFLEGFNGILQTDGYAGYNAAVEKHNITQITCMAHIRTKFYDAGERGEKISEPVLVLIKELYAIEREIKLKKLTEEEIVNVRTEQSAPIFKKLSLLVKEIKNKVLPQSETGKAITYFENMEERMANYLINGAADIDNNLCERTIRPLAIGRKNYLFAGSEEGAYRSGVIYSLILTCRSMGIDPYEYFTNTFAKMNSNPEVPFSDLLPGG